MFWAYWKKLVTQNKLGCLPTTKIPKYKKQDTKKFQITIINITNKFFDFDILILKFIWNL